MNLNIHNSQGNLNFKEIQTIEETSFQVARGGGSGVRPETNLGGDGCSC